MEMLILSVELWMYRDMIRVNVEKYCIYNGERKCLSNKRTLNKKDKRKNKKREKDKRRKLKTVV